LSTADLDFTQRIAAVEDRISQAVHRAGRNRSQVTLVAVTKKFSAEVLRVAYAQGLRVFGENYVQEFLMKKPALGDLPEAEFHLIGHLQSNKTRIAVELFKVIQTIDSGKLMERLDRTCGETGQTMDVLLEIKLAEEETKTGALPEDIPTLLNSAAKCRNLHVTGLMTIPPWSEDAELSRPYFRRLARLARQHSLAELSMGMSNDFEVAIEEGATIIRVGTALFGPRPKPAVETP
jgi:pyridoxal phosphate enzyme (YggS family)